MTGPSLKHQHSHEAIHEAALGEARELTDILAKCLQEGEQDKAYQVADIVIEHWETRTLKHAEAEEEGLYQDVLTEKPDMIGTITELSHDHDLMRRIVQNIKERMQSRVDEQIYLWMEALIIIDKLHNEDEMAKLLAPMERRQIS